MFNSTKQLHISNAKQYIVVVFFAVVVFALPLFTHAATLYFSPSSESFSVGQQLSVKVLVSSTDKITNAVGANISFSPQDMALVSMSESRSIVDVWGEKPNFNNTTGRVGFEGLILNGFQGSYGELVTLVFRAKSPGETTLRFSSGSVLAYDGLGTSILETLEQARFTITSQTVKPFEAPGKIPEGFTFTKNLNVSDENNDVAYLQICLAAEGIYEDDITGYFGPKTKAAVVAFQEKYFDDILMPWGFTEGTGIVHKTTRTKLNEVCFVAEEEEEEPPAPPFDVHVEPSEFKEEPTVPTVIEEVKKESIFTDIRFWIGTTIVLAIIIIFLLLVIIVLLFRYHHVVTRRHNIPNDVRPPHIRKRHRRRVISEK